MVNENIIKTGFIAEGTTCESCAEIIKKQALKVEGVKDVEFDYVTETGNVTYNKDKTHIDIILYKIEEKGYSCFILDEFGQSNNGKYNKILTKFKPNKTLGWSFAIIGILIIGYFLFILDNTTMII